MLWSNRIPTKLARDAAGRETAITVVAGSLGEIVPPRPPPHSWAARPETDVAIWSIRMAPGATWTMPPARAGTNRTLYVFAGRGMRIGDVDVRTGTGARLVPDMPVELVAGAEPGEALLLQGKPIGEQVVQYGPFVMNTRTEIQQAFVDFQRTRFGGWPWSSDAPVHARGEGRFARHADGRVERAD
jgi:redox-sensitive bicupin YhaK (pirin superfamily)